MSRKLVWNRTLKGVMDDKARAVARYEAYIEEVKAAVPPDRLLVFKVTEGWGPLCRFLGVPEPAEPFPNLNDRAAIKQVIRGIIKGAYITLGMYTVGAVAVVGGLWWALH